MASERTTWESQSQNAQKSDEQLDYEKAIDAFYDAEDSYRHAEEMFFSGEYLRVAAEGKGDVLVNYHVRYMEHLRTLLEHRNSALSTAKHELRAAVQLAPTQWRGPEGKASSIEYRGFIASSTTSRTFDAQSLIDETARSGRLQKLMSLRYVDSSGNEKSAVQQVHKIEYKTVSSWLKQEGLSQVIESAYDETEGTPKVMGPKPLAFIGDKKEKD